MSIPNFSKIFPERLKERRKIMGLTQENLADKLGESRTLTNLWETGRRFPGTAKLLSIAIFLNVSIDFLLGLTDDPTPPVKPTGERKTKKTSASD